MSDAEHEVETFESADAGASHTVPMQAGSVRKGGFIVRARELVARVRVSRERVAVARRENRSARALGTRDARAGASRRETDRGEILLEVDRVVSATRARGMAGEPRALSSVGFKELETLPGRTARGTGERARVGGRRGRKTAITTTR